jgi:hypothetical protein
MSSEVSRESEREVLATFGAYLDANLLFRVVYSRLRGKGTRKVAEIGQVKVTKDRDRIHVGAEKMLSRKHKMTVWRWVLWTDGPGPDGVKAKRLPGHRGKWWMLASNGENVDLYDPPCVPAGEKCIVHVDLHAHAG